MRHEPRPEPAPTLRLPAAWQYALMLDAMPLPAVAHAPAAPPCADPPALADELAAMRRRRRRRRA